MRGSDAETGSLFSDVDLEARGPKDQPLRRLRRLVDAALVDLPPAFAALARRSGGRRSRRSG